ncbi:MAG: HAMP domain-containing histidine kinase [Candidatus Aureabacteria bacterium]|nr:HAMP domain-containing histidine kinase [Candidatus Auribacterota bacterium]
MAKKNKPQDIIDSSLLFDSNDLQIDDKAVLSALEERSFSYGIECGLKGTLDRFIYFAKISQEIIEVLYENIKLEAISIYEKENCRINVFPLKNLSNNYLNKIEEKVLSCAHEKKKHIKIETNTHSNIKVEDFKTKAITSFKKHICIPIDFKYEHYSFISIFSSDPDFEKKIKGQQFRAVLTRACKIIIKVSEIINSEHDKTNKIIEDMSEGIILFKEGEEISIINTAAKKILGLPRKGVIDSTKKEFVKMIFLSMLNEFRSASESVEKEIKLSYPEEKILKIYVSPTGEDQKDALILIRDITQFKEVDRLKNEIISTVSHELRTPLTAIDTMINNMRLGITGALSDKQKEYLSRIKSNIDRLASLINNFLDISKLESGKITLLKDFYTIEEIFDEVIKLLQDQLHNKKISIKKKISKKIDWAYIDKERMEQVLINLIYNAVKFTHVGGTIQVKTSLTKQKTLRIDIIDNGIGIEKDELTRIFQKFSQLGRVYGAGEKGTGLGLAICKKITEMHSGRIYVKSPPDIKNWPKGSQFVLEIPIINENTILQKIINSEIEKASEGSKEFSVISLIYPQKLSIDKLKDFVAQNKDSIKRTTDILFHFPKSHKMYIILQCKSKELKKITARIKRLNNNKNAVLKTYVYPKDFIDGNDFIKKVEKL